VRGDIHRQLGNQVDTINDFRKAADLYFHIGNKQYYQEITNLITKL